MGLVSLLLDTAEIRAGYFCHQRLADTPICGDDCRGERVSGAAAETLFRADFGPLKTELVRAPGLAILLLLVVTTLGVYKPWGLTRYGQRKQQERGKVQQQPDNETPLGVKIFFAAIGVLVLLFVLLHLTGHGFGNHGH